MSLFLEVTSRKDSSVKYIINVDLFLVRVSDDGTGAVITYSDGASSNVKTEQIAETYATLKTALGL